MSSRHGSRPAGTDGADFRHRERIAPQYNVSTVTKKRVAALYFLHFILWILMLGRLLPEICLRFGYNINQYVGKWNLPQGSLWEYAWLMFSPMPVLFGYMSLNRNRENLMRISILGILCFALGPIFYGVFDNAYHLMDFYYTRKGRFTVLGFPAVVLLYLYFSVCMQVHGFSMWFGWKLLRAWALATSTRSKKKQ